MKNLLILFFLLGTATLQAQNTYTYSLSGNRAIVSISDGQVIGLNTQTIVGLKQDQSVYVWTPERTMASSYSLITVNGNVASSPIDAVAKINTLIASSVTGTSQNGGTTTVNQAPLTFGTTNPVSSTYTAAGTITTTNKLAVVLFNTGSNNGTYTLNGTVITIVPKDVIRFSVIEDKTTGKYTPIGTLSVDGTGTTIVAQVVSTQ